MRIFGGWRRCPGCGRLLVRLERDEDGSSVCPRCGSVVWPAPLEEPRDETEVSV